MAANSVQLISKKIIKPSPPTPSSLKSYKLSFRDQVTTDSYIPIASFYPNPHHNTTLDATQISELLEKSLSILLKSYYPFAGTLIDNVSIDCNDKGVTLLETQINSSMEETLQERDSTVQDIVFPSELPWNHFDKDNLVIAQLNHFECGGIALGVCMSHKLGDASTLISFMNDWAAMTRQSNEEPSPKFIGASIYPPNYTPVVPIYETPRSERVAGRRFAFPGKKIAQLKQVMAGESGVENPTRVEVVTAFLCKSAMAASLVANLRSFSPFVLIQPVNLRRLTTPPLPNNSAGNFSYIFATPIINEDDMKLSRLVSKLRSSKEEFYEKCTRKNLNELLLEDLKENLNESNEHGITDYNLCTSLCGFPLNNLDFGWGRPMKVIVGSLPYKNGFMLVDDNNGDGIEALVTLDENVMSVFESDKDLLDFSSPY